MVIQQDLIIYSRKLKKQIPNLTRFWIVDKKLDRKISSLEANGEIKKLSNIINNNSLIFNQLVSLHQKEINIRKQILSTMENVPEYMKKRILDKNAGIGGIENFSEKPFKIKCLHLWTAYHLGDKDFENFIGYYVLKQIKI